MKITIQVETNLKLDEAKGKVREATRMGLRDTIVNIHRDALRGSPIRFGTNRRSLASEVSGLGMVATGGEGSSERMVDDSKLEAAIYSSSGYGGFLETGTSKMPARPYIYPAFNRNKGKLIPAIKGHL